MENLCWFTFWAPSGYLLSLRCYSLAYSRVIKSWPSSKKYILTRRDFTVKTIFIYTLYSLQFENLYWFSFCASSRYLFSLKCYSLAYSRALIGLWLADSICVCNKKEVKGQSEVWIQVQDSDWPSLYLHETKKMRWVNQSALFSVLCNVRQTSLYED